MTMASERSTAARPALLVVCVSRRRRSDSGNGSGASRMPFTRLNMAVVMPTPSASTRTTAPAKAGARRRRRAANWSSDRARSWRQSDMIVEGRQIEIPQARGVGGCDATIYHFRSGGFYHEGTHDRLLDGYGSHGPRLRLGRDLPTHGAARGGCGDAQPRLPRPLHHSPRRLEAPRRPGGASAAPPPAQGMGVRRHALRPHGGLRGPRGGGRPPRQRRGADPPAGDRPGLVGATPQGAQARRRVAPGGRRRGPPSPAGGRLERHSEARGGAAARTGGPVGHAGRPDIAVPRNVLGRRGEGRAPVHVPTVHVGQVRRDLDAGIRAVSQRGVDPIHLVVDVGHVDEAGEGIRAEIEPGAPRPVRGVAAVGRRRLLHGGVPKGRGAGLVPDVHGVVRRRAVGPLDEGRIVGLVARGARPRPGALGGVAVGIRAEPPRRKEPGAVAEGVELAAGVGRTAGHVVIKIAGVVDRPAELRRADGRGGQSGWRQEDDGEQTASDESFLLHSSSPSRGCFSPRIRHGTTRSTARPLYRFGNCLGGPGCDGPRTGSLWYARSGGKNRQGATAARRRGCSCCIWYLAYLAGNGGRAASRRAGKRGAGTGRTRPGSKVPRARRRRTTRPRKRSPTAVSPSPPPFSAGRVTRCWRSTVKGGRWALTCSCCT